MSELFELNSVGGCLHLQWLTWTFQLIVVVLKRRKVCLFGAELFCWALKWLAITLIGCAWTTPGGLYILDFLFVRCLRATMCCHSMDTLKFNHIRTPPPPQAARGFEVCILLLVRIQREKNMWAGREIDGVVASHNSLRKRIVASGW